MFGFSRNRWLNTLYGILWETKYGRFTALNIPKCEHFTLLVCPLRFLVISAMRRLGNAQSFKTYMFRFWAFCHERDPGQAGYPTLTRLQGKLSPRLTGLPYLADRATRLGGSPHLSCKRDQNKIRNYMDRRVTPPRRVTSPTWGSPPPCTQALSLTALNTFLRICNSSEGFESNCWRKCLWEGCTREPFLSMN